MALGAHKVVVELIATGQKAAGEFRKVSAEAEGLAVAQKGAGGASALLGSNMLKAGVAAAGAFAAFKIGKSVVDDLVDTFTSAASEVRAFQRVSGASAEDASKFTFALKTVGVSAEQAATGVFMLGKKIGQGKINLEQYGVAVKKTASGSTDLTGTVLNIADAYKHMQDPAKRSALAMEAFGRSGKNMLPFLARGREGIKALFDEAGRTNHIFSQDDLDTARKFGLATHELGQTFEGLKIKAGGALTPVVTDLTEIISKMVQLADAAHVFDALTIGFRGLLALAKSVIDPMKSLADSIGLTSNHVDTFTVATKYLNDRQREFAALVAEGNGHSEKAKALRKEISSINGALSTTQDKVSESLKTTAQKAEDADRALNTLKGTLFGFGDAQRGAQESLLRFQDAQRGAADAVDAFNAARIKGRDENETEEQFQRRLAGLQDDVKQGYLDIAAAHDDVARAAVDAITSQDAYNKAAGDKGARQALINQLVEAKAKFGDTTGAIQAQIDKLNAYNATALADKTATVHLNGVQDVLNGLGEVQRRLNTLSDKSVNLHLIGGPTLRASGGPVKRGQPYVVGEEGPELFFPEGNGKILSHKASMAKLNPAVTSGGGSSAPVYNITVNGALNSAQAGREVVNAIKEYERGSGKSWRG